MGLTGINALIFSTLVPIVEPFNALRVGGFIMWPSLAVRWAYDHFESLYSLGVGLLVLLLRAFTLFAF
jgi:hypothetical protein